ncbi:MAG: hypothetical protein HKN72_13310 [Gemmatimonadetes bacterium]|nr:hypothetical protein [Gemmatimonadota bacterium]
MTEENTAYRERTPWPSWVATIYWVAIMAVVAPLLVGYDTDLPAATRGLLALGLVGLAAGLSRVIGGLTVLVQETRLYLFLGSYPIIKRVVPYAEILRLRSTEYSPIGDFGGWGARGVGRKKAWTARGNRAVVLTLTDDRELYVGSDHPQRLEERIRTTAGDRLG